MNFKILFYYIGTILKVEAILLGLPLIVSFIYQENTWLSWLIPIASVLVLGFLLTIKKPKNQEFFAKEGFVLVGLSWIIISLFGCLPFVISQQIPSFIDAFFETVSGFTTTGASILSDVETLSHSMLFWRSFTHWVGGMGVLVFILAILPSSDGQNIFILRAESPGPQVGKLVSKIKSSARILYLIYLGLTVLETIFLLCGGMSLFESMVNSFATAGTGGFTVVNSDFSSAATVMPFYSTYCQIVIAVFMILFGVNFNLYFFLFIGKFKDFFKSEELRAYLLIILASVALITSNLVIQANTVFGIALRDAFFQVSSLMTTTGFATADYATWPQLSQAVLFIVMFVGGCAGSTAGGIKVSRIVILCKAFVREIDHTIHPNRIRKVKLEEQTIDEKTVHGVLTYFALFIFLTAIGFLIVSLDGKPFTTSLSAVVACINNVGPGFELISPSGNYGSFSILSKIVLIAMMLLGRLELYPLIMSLNPKVYLKK